MLAGQSKVSWSKLTDFWTLKSSNSKYSTSHDVTLSPAAITSYPGQFRDGKYYENIKTILFLFKESCNVMKSVIFAATTKNCKYLRSSPLCKISRLLTSGRSQINLEQGYHYLPALAAPSRRSLTLPSSLRSDPAYSSTHHMNSFYHSRDQTDTNIQLTASLPSDINWNRDMMTTCSNNCNHTFTDHERR